MGKNHRHKKTLKSEKSKIKLKTKPGSKTKFLPKGANVTDVNFKVKPIVIQEQLQANKFDEPLTKRKLNFKDLLTRLNHHNSSAKFEACEGLLELVQSCSQDVLEQNVYALSHGVCKLVLDNEKKIRQKAIKLVSAIIENVSPAKLQPFFDILTSYASCAMTHIDKNIQEDSLLLIDAFLKHCPLLVVNSFDKIFTNFLSLISKLRSDSKLSRTLTVNLGSKMTSTKWRIRVLTRLQGILQAVVDKKENVSERRSDCVVIRADEVGSIVPIYKGLQCSPVTLLNYSTAGGNTDSNVARYVSVLVPLLYETWAEVVPSSDNMDSGATVIPQDAASILKCVIGIYYLLWKLMTYSSDKNKAMKLFLSKDNQKFLNHILNQFPYRQQEAQKQKNKEKKLMEVNVDPKCVVENFLISYMFCVLYKVFTYPHYLKKACEVLEYLKMCLTNRNYVTAENIENLSLILRVIFFENSKSWSTQKTINIQELLDNVVQFYNALRIENYGRIEIFNFLCDVVQLSHIRSQKYETFLGKLPILLCKPEISQQVVDTLSLLSRQNNGLFLEALLKNLPKILENLPILKINETDLYPAHLKIVCMFYYLSFKSEHLLLLEKFVEMNQDSKVATYVQEVLQEKKM